MSTTGTPAAAPRTLAQKVWDDHVVVKGEDGAPDLIYIDLHLVHEVTSPQAFDGLRMSGRGVRHPELTVATEAGDFTVPLSAIAGAKLVLTDALIRATAPARPE